MFVRLSSEMVFVMSDYRGETIVNAINTHLQWPQPRFVYFLRDLSMACCLKSTSTVFDLRRILNRESQLNHSLFVVEETFGKIHSPALNLSWTTFNIAFVHPYFTFYLSRNPRQSPKPQYYLHPHCPRPISPHSSSRCGSYHRTSTRGGFYHQLTHFRLPPCW